MKKPPQKQAFTAKQLRHAADIADKRVGRMLNEANDCEELHVDERAAAMRKAHKAKREAAEFRAMALAVDAEDLD